MVQQNYFQIYTDYIFRYFKNIHKKKTILLKNLKI